MVLEQEWALQAAEKCYLQGEQKEEKFYQLKATHEEGGLSSFILLGRKLNVRNIDSLKNTSAFKEVYEFNQSVANKLLVLYSAPAQGKKLGISVSKKIGNSVVRHRAARLIRVSYLHLKEQQQESFINLNATLL